MNREEPGVRHRYVYRAAIPAIVGIIAVAGCGSNKSRGGGAGGGGAHTVVLGMPAPPAVCVGSAAPLTGPLSALGLGMKNSVAPAVKQANQAKKVNGWTIKFD